MRLNYLLGTRLIRIVTNLLIRLSSWSLLAFLHFSLINNILENVDITSLKFLVLDNTSGEKNIETGVFSLLQIFVESIPFCQCLSLNGSPRVLSIPHEEHVLIFLPSAR